MELLSRKEFIGDMPRQYRETIRGIRKALFREEMLLAQKRQSGVKAVDDPEIEQIHDRICILVDMLSDMYRAKRTAEHYYETGGRYDDEYCLLGRIAGGDYFRLGSPVEGLVARGVRDSCRY